MSEFLPSRSVDNQFNIVFWNLLLNRTRTDVVPSQRDRMEAQAKTLMDLGKSLDAVGLCEVEETAHGHNGKAIAQLTGNGPGFWGHHSRKREYLGLFGAHVVEAEFVDLGHNKK